MNYSILQGMTIAQNERFIRHVSFDDLLPTMTDDQVRQLKSSNHFIGFTNPYYHIPPQYNPLYKRGGETPDKSPTKNIFQTSDNPKLITTEETEHNLLQRSQQNSFSLHGIDFQQGHHNRKSGNEYSLGAFALGDSGNSAIARLPDPPAKSALKMNRRSSETNAQLLNDLDDNSTQRNTELNAGSNKGYTQAAFANLNEVEDRVAKGKKQSSKPENQKRSKSFAGMSDEELAKLEELYISQSRMTPKIDLKKYDFGEQHTFFDNSNGKNTHSFTPLNDVLKVVYPSRPVVTYNAISLTVRHPDYDSLAKRTKEEFCNKFSAESPDNRTISCYISGRRFTWSTVDWYVENFARDGDHLVIITVIPEFDKKRRSPNLAELRRKSAGNVVFSDNDETADKYPQRRRSSFVSESSSFDSGDRPYSEKLWKRSQKVARSLVDYYTARLMDKKIKITVEMVKRDSSKEALILATALYNPTIEIFASVSANIHPKGKQKKVKLPYFVMKHFAIPTMVIPFEFIDPRLLNKPKLSNQEKIYGSNLDSKVSKEDRLNWLGKTIQRTLVNPYSDDLGYFGLEPEATGKSDESVASVEEYTPAVHEQRKLKELFERNGYKRPAATRKYLSAGSLVEYDEEGMVMTPPGSRGSKRGSRLESTDNFIYKVRSMVDSVSQDSISSGADSESLRKTKSANTRFKKEAKHVHDHTKPASTPSLAKTKSMDPNHISMAKGRKGNKTKLKGLFKKVFG